MIKLYQRPRDIPTILHALARALNSALCCFLFTPTFHASSDRSALSLSDCPENRSRRIPRAGPFRQMLS